MRFLIVVLTVVLVSCSLEIDQMFDPTTRLVRPGILNYPQGQSIKIGNQVPIPFEAFPGVANTYVLGNNNAVNLLKPASNVSEDPALVVLAVNLIIPPDAILSANVEVFVVTILFGSGGASGLQRVSMDLTTGGIVANFFGNLVQVDIGGISTDIGATGALPSRGFQAQASLAYGTRPTETRNRISFTFPPSALAASPAVTLIPVFGNNFVESFEISFAPSTAAGVLAELWTAVPGAATSVMIAQYACPGGVVTTIPKLLGTTWVRIVNGATPLTNLSVTGVLYL